MIWYHLYNLKDAKNTYGRVILLVKLQTEAAKYSCINSIVSIRNIYLYKYEYLCNYKLETIICWTVQELDVREIAFNGLYTSQPLYLDISLKFLKECNDNHKSIDFNPVTNLCHKYFFKPRHFFLTITSHLPNPRLVVQDHQWKY